MKNLYLILLLLAVSLTAIAQAPAGYYNSADGLKERNLKTALSEIIDNQVVNSYSYLWTLFRTSDVRPDGNVWDVYSECVFVFGSDQCGSSGYNSVCDCYNREHMIPQSWFNSNLPMYSDGFHIYPTDGKVNALRGNLPHGETNSAPLGGSALGKIGPSNVAGYTSSVYEPADEYKGDIARVYFYFVTRYQTQLPSMNGTVLTTDAYPSLTTWFLNLMLKWHREDPVSQKEIDRNNAVSIAQVNRNPYVDYPDLVEHVWGNKKTVAWYQANDLAEEEIGAKFTISPIPASSYFMVSHPLSGTMEYALYRTTGEEVDRGEVMSGDQIDVLNLEDGIYVLRIKHKESISIHKVIVKH